SRLPPVRTKNARTIIRFIWWFNFDEHPRPGKVMAGPPSLGVSDFWLRLLMRRVGSGCCKLASRWQDGTDQSVDSGPGDSARQLEGFLKSVVDQVFLERGRGCNSRRLHFAASC